MRRVLFLAIAIAGSACHPPAATDGPRGSETQGPAPRRSVTLTTDSTQYTVRFDGRMYRARIGYTYVNRSGNAVSTNHCHTPPPPALEKRVGDQWVRAYDPVLLACLTLPPFQIPAGTTYRGVLDFAAAPPGRTMAPTLEVESVPGVYRLRWILRSGGNPDAPASTPVEAISNEFRFVER